MGAIDETKRRVLEDLVVEWLLATRAEYLASPQANVLKHWDQLQDRIRAAARTTASPEEWLTAVRKGLRLSAPSPASSRCSAALASEVQDETTARAFLALIEARHAYLLARARLAAEERKAVREAKEGDGDRSSAT